MKPQFLSFFIWTLNNQNQSFYYRVAHLTVLFGDTFLLKGKSVIIY